MPVTWRSGDGAGQGRAERRSPLVTSLSEEGERVPMLLDDPFANYDDVRLERALSLLVSLKEVPQILLFTCRDDVADTARRLRVPVLAL